MTLMKDSTGRWRTRSLFIETIGKDQIAAGYVPIFSLKADPLFIDLHSVYIEESDPTEYTFALRAFGSWEHFEVISQLAWFKVHLDKWRRELEVKLRSEGIAALAKSARKDGSRGLSAAKFLAEKGWEAKKRGRPSKDEIETEKKQQAEMERELGDDAARIAIH